jgi:quercetin dioxygenase-like cupin family protein
MDIVKIDSLVRFSSDKYARIPIGNAEGLLRLLCFEAKQGVPLHTHPTADEYFYVIKGKGTVTIKNEKRGAESGSFIKVPASVPHKWECKTEELILLSVLIPSTCYKLADEAARMDLLETR